MPRTYLPHPMRLPPRASGQAGTILLLSLIIVIGLCVIVLSFAEGVVVDELIARNQSEDAVTAWAARGGVYRALPYLLLDEEQAYDSLNEDWWRQADATVNDTEFRLGDARVVVKVIDEDRKFNIMATIVEDEDRAEAAREILARIIKHARREFDGGELYEDDAEAEEIVKNIVKWLEDDGTNTDQDSSLAEEATTGRSADEDPDVEIKKVSPYPILTIGELMQVKGVTRELIYGPAKKTFDDSDPDEDLTPEEERDRALEQRIGLYELITCHTLAVGTVNINTAPREVLLSLVDEMPEEIVDAIISAREQSEEDRQEQEENPPEEPAEDVNSFRAQELSAGALEAFKAKLSEYGGLENTDALTTEIWEEMRVRLAVRSEVFSVQSTAVSEKVDEYGDAQRGKIEQTWRGLFLRVREGDQFKLQLMILDRIE